MKRVRARNMMGVTVVVLAVFTAVTVSVVNHTAQHSACTILTPAGGAVIGLTLLVLMVAARALLRQIDREADSGHSAVERHACPECGRVVHGAWRMCPYCGAMVGSDHLPEGGEIST